MKKFLQKCSFFLLIIFMVWAANESLYRLVPNNYSVKNKGIQMGYDDVEVLILGNSHAFYGLNPRNFTMKAYNLSNVSQTLLFDALLIDKHLANLHKLKYVVLPIEYTTLSHSDDHAELQWRKYFYESQMELETGDVSDFDIKKYSLALVPPVQINVTSIGTFFREGTLAQCDSLGFGSNFGVLAEYNNPAAGINKMKQHEDGSLLFGKNLLRVEAILKRCAEKGVKVVLVNIPVTTHYADNANPVKRKKIVNTCKMLASRSNVYYLDMFRHQSFNNDDFYDVDHLNTIGAEKCSNLVNGYLMALN